MPACRSTSRCCSLASSSWRRPRHTCAASSGASRRGSIPTSAPSPRCSSAAGTPRSRARYPSCATGSASPSRSGPTRRPARCSSRPAGSALYNFGARPQRLLWASTGTKDPSASDILYVKALAAPFTVNTMPEGTLKALADHGELRRIMPADGGDCEEVLAQFARPASTSLPWRPNCRTKAPSRS